MDDCKAYVSKQPEPCLFLSSLKKLTGSRPPMPAAPAPPKVKI